MWPFQDFFDSLANAQSLKSLFMCGSAARDQDRAKV